MGNSKANINVRVTVSGVRNSGKTFVLTNIVDALKERGFTVELDERHKTWWDDPYKESCVVRKLINNGELQS